IHPNGVAFFISLDIRSSLGYKKVSNFFQDVYSKHPITFLYNCSFSGIDKQKYSVSSFIEDGVFFSRDVWIDR
ncbi:TPA: hypothetical protein ACIET7_001758, partial [Streptococcus pyogenes]|nr:hypothetical protein [Streptococcus pyogenes]HES9443030.1 hypothetical protein [Streptococcus pyogenes]